MTSLNLHQRKSRKIAWRKRVALKIPSLQSLQPIVNQSANVNNPQSLMQSRIFFQIRIRQLKQRRRWAEPIFLQMYKRARELDKPLVKGIVRPFAIGQPQFFQYIVRLKIKLAIEALEISEIMRVQFPSFELLN